jgi:hypothetical protein
MPTGELVTVPEPVPAFVTVSVRDLSTKVAVTVLAASIVTMHVVAVPLHPPPVKPLKSAFAAGAAVSVTTVLLS